MEGLWVEGINYMIGVGCVFGTLYTILFLLAALNKMLSD